MKDIKKYLPAYALTFLMTFAVWIFFSGLLDLYHLILGALSAGLVSFLSARIIFPEPLKKDLMAVWLRFLMYFPWLIKEIFMSSFHILKIVLSPDIKNAINPKIFEFKSKIKNPTGLVTFANSITLTPGTITVKVSSTGKFRVHAIDDTTAGTLPGIMEKKSAKIFGEKIYG
ncbi:MAG: Na+/H+ antiporter subunit E [Thermodesulfobacteriota bacterium]